MKTITVYFNCMEHIITIKDKNVTVFNTFFEEVVSPAIFDKYIVSRDFTGVINSEEIFISAARRRSLHSAKHFISSGMCWIMGGFTLNGWEN